MSNEYVVLITIAALENDKTGLCTWLKVGWLWPVKAVSKIRVWTKCFDKSAFNSSHFKENKSFIVSGRSSFRFYKPCVKIYFTYWFVCSFFNFNLAESCVVIYKNIKGLKNITNGVVYSLSHNTILHHCNICVISIIYL